MIETGARRLLETFDILDLHAAQQKPRRPGAVRLDGVEPLVLGRVEEQPPNHDLEVYPCLPRADLATSSAAASLFLLSGNAAGPKRRGSCSRIT